MFRYSERRTSVQLSLSIKTLFRSPVRTILTFILLGVVTFAFFSQTAEYAITAREFDNAVMQYRAVGAAEAAPPIEATPSIIPYTMTPAYIETDKRLPQKHLELSRGLFNIYSVDYERYKPLTRDQIDAISELPYISVSDKRYMTSGVSDKYYRLDDEPPFYNYTARCVIEATLTEVEFAPSSIQDNSVMNRIFVDDT